MASKPFQRSFGGWFDILKDWRPTCQNIKGAAAAVPSLISKLNFRMNHSEISWRSGFHFYVPLFLLDDEKRIVVAMIDHDMIEDCSKRLTLIRLICL